MLPGEEGERRRVEKRGDDGNDGVCARFAARIFFRSYFVNRRVVMKKVVYLIVIMVMGMSLQAAQAETSEFLYDMCLRADSTQTVDTFFDLRLGLTYVGGGHYALHGISIINQGLGSAINGNAEIRSDGSIVMTLVNARKDDVELWTTTFYIQFKSDGSGSYHSIKEIKVFGTSGITHDYDQGVVTVCQ